MGLTRIVEPLIDPITLEIARKQSRVEEVIEDDLISIYIAAATRWTEIFLSRQLITATWKKIIDKFPLNQVIKLPNGPVQTVTSIKFFDVDSIEQTVPSIDYIVDIDSIVARVVPVPEKTWPTTENRINAVSIEYIAGYGDDTLDIPEAIRVHIQMLTAHLFEHRESVSELSLNDVPQSVRFLLEPFEVKEFD